MKWYLWVIIIIGVYILMAFFSNFWKALKAAASVASFKEDLDVVKSNSSSMAVSISVAANAINQHSTSSHNEHLSIESAIRDGLKENSTSTALAVQTMFNHQKELDEKNYLALSKDHASIVDSVKNIQLLPGELMRLNTEVNELRSKVHELEVANAKLEEKCRQLERNPITRPPRNRSDPER